MHVKTKILVLALFLAGQLAGRAYAQANAQLRLRLSRDFGTAFAGRIRGTFSLHVDDPDNLSRVVFLLDDEPIGEDEDAPFRLQFRTGNFADGAHVLSAIGYTADGEELLSNALQREFLSSGQTSRYSTILFAILAVLIIGGRLIASRIANRGQDVRGRPAVSGFLGGTICPRCDRPYALHIWGLNLVATRLDRCPHCGKWAFVRRVSPQALQEAAEQLEVEKGVDRPAVSLNEEEKLRRDLEDSRFDDAL